MPSSLTLSSLSFGQSNKNKHIIPQLRYHSIVVAGSLGEYAQSRENVKPVHWIRRAKRLVVFFHI